MMIGHYSPYCICTSCGNHAFWSSLSAMSDMQIVERAKGRNMNEKQEKMIADIEMRLWNSMTKGVTK